MFSVLKHALSWLNSVLCFQIIIHKRKYGLELSSQTHAHNTHTHTHTRARARARAHSSVVVERWGGGGGGEGERAFTKLPENTTKFATLQTQLGSPRDPAVGLAVGLGHLNS